MPGRPSNFFRSVVFFVLPVNEGETGWIEPFMQVASMLSVITSNRSISIGIIVFFSWLLQLIANHQYMNPNILTWWSTQYCFSSTYAYKQICTYISSAYDWVVCTSSCILCHHIDLSYNCTGCFTSSSTFWTRDKFLILETEVLYQGKFPWNDSWVIIFSWFAGSKRCFQNHVS